MWALAESARGPLILSFLEQKAASDENRVSEPPTEVTNRLLLTSFKNVPEARLEQDKSRLS